ncbi:GNAT family N-acetyltransferase [Falsibacillus pallidus]|uniref:GNAT family N-acetyltransferase n=1 Tax=Falsibacillus pallidus TaxID=493781 RepID=UPI003D9612B5
METERLALQPLHLKYADRVEELANDYDVAKTTLGMPYPYPKGGAKAFIEDRLAAEKDGGFVIYAITLKETDEFIGMITFTINERHKRCEFAYWLGKEYWGNGYGTEAAKRMLDLAFNELNLNKVYAQAFAGNPGSWRVMEKIGMTYEGKLRQHVSRFDEYHDLVQYGLLREEYLQGKN